MESKRDGASGRRLSGNGRRRAETAAQNINRRGVAWRARGGQEQEPNPTRLSLALRQAGTTASGWRERAEAVRRDVKLHPCSLTKPGTRCGSPHGNITLVGLLTRY